MRAWGLRARLLLAFVLLGTITAAAVAGGLYVQARDVILQKAQDAAVLSMLDRLGTVSIQALPIPESTLAQITDALTNRPTATVVIYKGKASQGGLDPAMIPPELRQKVRGGQVAWQRVAGPSLITGTTLTLALSNGISIPSGLEVYTARSLVAEQVSIDNLATRAWLTGGLSLVFALLLALLAARSVLRPVRDLHRAAHQLGVGDLSTRLEVHGSDELAGVARTFNNTAEALERQVHELRRFVADVSHELRTPLAAMAAVTDVLDEEAPHLPGDAGKAAKLVSQETQNLTRLVNDLIEVSRFDSGTATLALDNIDVAAAVTATLRARGWTGLVETDLPTGIQTLLDPRRLDIIIANLIGNALRHGAPPVSVRLRADQNWITVEVSDHGPGLDPQVLPHVFDRFYKADTARSRSEGSGLGLAIAWENARLHRGSLAAGNQPTGGAVFVLHLPAGGNQ